MCVYIYNIFRRKSHNHFAYMNWNLRILDEAFTIKHKTRYLLSMANRGNFTSFFGGLAPYLL